MNGKNYIHLYAKDISFITVNTYLPTSYDIIYLSITWAMSEASIPVSSNQSIYLLIKYAMYISCCNIFLMVFFNSHVSFKRNDK